MTHRKILVVEDDRDISETMERVLTRLGHTVMAIVDKGEEAVEFAHSKHPDLVLMDIVLAGEMDGIEAGKRIKDDLNIPIVYLTGFADKVPVVESGGNAPLIKPFTTEELQAAIEVAFFSPPED